MTPCRSFVSTLLLTLLAVMLCVGRVDAYEFKLKKNNTISDVVKTRAGMIRGYVHNENTLAWRSVPFAAPPIDNLRWKAPKPPKKWTGIREAKENPKKCSQMGVNPETGLAEPVGSEDCLYANIFRPKSQERNLPVYVWLHGGSNNNGSISSFDGDVLANKSNVVVVMLQYRLGPLGFLSHPSLNDSNRKKASINFGTLDHLRALKWIRRNISAFGGNPSNVTLTGESAGAHNVMNLITSPLAKGLFHKAIMQSGGMLTIPKEQAEAKGDALISALLQADGMDKKPKKVAIYLRSKTAGDIIKAAYAFGNPQPSSATQDGFILPAMSEVEVISSGKYNKVPVILGTNEHELKTFMPGVGDLVKNTYKNEDNLEVTLPIPSGAFSWSDLGNILINGELSLDDVLPREQDKFLYSAVAQYGSLAWRKTFADDLARAFTQQQKNVYVYQFKWDGSQKSAYNFIFGAAHGTEIPFFFGLNRGVYGGVAFNSTFDTAGRKALSTTLMSYAANFSLKGNPNSSGLPLWTPWSKVENRDKVLLLDANESEQEIEMSNEEITQKTVDALFKSLHGKLPKETRNILSLFNMF